MSTIRDVATRAGVSITTVSYALNRPGRVSPALRARVEDAVRQLDYHPEGAARALRTRQSPLVSLIVPDVANHFYAALARGLSDVVTTHGLQVVLGNTDSREEDERTFLRNVAVQRMRGAVIVPFHLQADALRRACPTDMPLVVIGGSHIAGDLPAISIDDSGGAHEAVSYLLATGRRRVAMLIGQPDTPPSRHRHAGYVRAHVEAGLHPDPALSVASDFQQTGGEKAIEHLYRQGLSFDAVFAANDLIAIGAARALRRQGLRIPDDVALVGFDDIDEAEIIEPALTTVRQPSREIGRAAGELLLDLADGRANVARQQMLTCTFIRRDSA